MRTGEEIKSKGARGDGNTDADEQSPTEELTSLAKLPTEAGTQLEADERHCDTDGANHDGSEHEAYVTGAECKPDGQVIEAQRQRGEQEPASAGTLRTGCASRGSLCLDDRVEAGHHQDDSAEPARGMTEVVRQPMTKGEAKDRHSRLERTEGDADLQALPRGNAQDANGDGCREVREPECKCDE